MKVVRAVAMAIVGLVGVSLAPGNVILAATLTTLHAFAGSPDGSEPLGGLVIDAKGTTLYGATYTGGATGVGTVFKLDPTTRTLTVLHSFTNGADGGYPYGGVTIKNGALYGTTSQGGAGLVGTMFKLDLATKKLTTLHAFKRGVGEVPLAGVVFGTANTLYGTTSDFGAGTFGTVFQFDLATRILTRLHTFAGRADGSTPRADLVLRNGWLYGTTSVAGANDEGTVFALNPRTKRLFTLYAFSGSDGEGPFGKLVFDSAGALYGTTTIGGAADSGTVFELSLSGPHTAVALRSLYGFADRADGAQPWAGVVFDSTGVLYGTTTLAGAHGMGRIFKLGYNPRTSRLVTLHSFTGGNRWGKSAGASGAPEWCILRHDAAWRRIPWRYGVQAGSLSVPHASPVARDGGIKTKIPVVTLVERGGKARSVKAVRRFRWATSVSTLTRASTAATASRRPFPRGTPPAHWSCASRSGCGRPHVPSWSSASSLWP